jgi:hypothetical protein
MMRKGYRKDRRDLAGQTFGQLTVVAFDRRHRYPSGQTGAKWLCRCACGGGRSVFVKDLVSGHTRSCGCLQRATSINNGLANARHGHCANGRSTQEYKTWGGMRRRCTNPNSQDYARYGGRGICVCERWQTFENFLTDMGPRPSPKHSIDRMDNDGGYWCGHCSECTERCRPANCRWATAKGQARNRRSNRMLCAGGELSCISEWAERSGINPATLLDRIDAGWSPEDAVRRPAGESRPSG